MTPETPIARVIPPLELTTWMATNGITVMRLAELLGLSRWTITTWRQGENAPPAMLPLALATLRREGLLEPSATPRVARRVHAARRALLTF